MSDSIIQAWERLDWQSPALTTPCYVLHEGLLRDNLAILNRVQKHADCRILLALKAFANWKLFPLLRDTLAGSCASGRYEARLGYEEFGGETHVFSPAYNDAEINELVRYCDHIVFNSFDQWQRYRAEIAAAAHKQQRTIDCGLRINPQHSEVEVALYDPCQPGSRLGIVRDAFTGQSLDGISGLHFHTLCEKNVDALERTLAAVEAQFGEFFANLRWINFGGGHHITRADYDVQRLIELIQKFRMRHPHLTVYLEPGEAVVLNAGVLVTTVLDILHTPAGDVAIVDTSAAAHMPDVLEMPYRPEIIGAGTAEQYSYRYRLGGPTCLAGDIIGDYSFAWKLARGDRLVLQDMAHYSMVKNNTFNGVPLPAIIRYTPDDNTFHTDRQFDYDEYKRRLG